MEKEKCFGANPKRYGGCRVLNDCVCDGYGERNEKGGVVKCSFYKTEAEYQKGFNKNAYITGGE